MLQSQGSFASSSGSADGFEGMSLEARFGPIAHVTTRPQVDNEGGPSGGSAASSSGRSKSRGSSHAAREIHIVGGISELYELGAEVMPSTHSYMKVLFATRLSDSLQVVIKVRYKPKCFRSREDERSWRHNTEFLMNLPANVGVATLYEVIEDPKAFYVIMEKVNGMDLFETLEAEGRISMSMAREILRQLLTSLTHLHQHNAVHKDLKLENVMYDTGQVGSKSSAGLSQVKVIDFDTVEEWTPNSPIAKDVVGTDQYISQEAYAGKYSPLSDIFAVGVVAYRLLSGKFPFHDGMFDDKAGENWVGSPTMAQIRRRLKNTKVDFTVHAVFRDNPEACDLVTRMLAYAQDSRPTAAAALEHPWFTEARSKSTSKLASDDDVCSYFEDLIDDGVIIAQ